MKRVLVLLFMLSLIISGYAQNRILDSLLMALENYEPEDTLKVHTLNDISYYTSENDPKKAMVYAEQSLRLAKELNFRRGVASAYRNMAQSYWNQLDNVNCIRFALLALKEYEYCKIPRGVNACYTMIAASYSQSNDFDKALYYYKLSYAYGVKINNKIARGGHLTNIASIFERKGNYDSALWYNKKALEAWENANDQLRIPIGISSVGVAYKNLGDYSSAQRYLLKALPLAQKVENKSIIAGIYHNLGDIYCKTGRYDESEAYLMKAIHTINETGYKRSQEDLYESLIELETSRKNYKAAFYHLENLLGLKDSVYSQERFKQISELEARFETEKKEQTIRLLEQEKRVETTLRNSLMAGVLLTLIASIFIYRLQRSRTLKTRQLLEVQQILNDKLKEVDKLKSRFFANISHEFRTPLTLILAPLNESLRKNSFPAAEKEQLMLVKRNANRLLELVNQLLDLSKLESGKMELQVKPGNVEALLKVIAASFDSWAQHKQINFVKNIRLSGPHLWHDQDKMEKIITNLLANAFKFTPADGTVTLTVDTLRKNEGGTMLSIIIADTGKGIHRDEQEQIFLPFYQAKQTIEGHQGGTGLGLSLVKELIKVYRGIIRLESKTGEGTTFVVELPADATLFSPEEMDEAGEILSIVRDASFSGKGYPNDQTDVAKEYEPFVQGKDSVLIVEDNTDLRNFMTSILEHEFTVFTAVDGEEAVKVALRIVPSLILSDLMMPKMDGIQLTQKIKNDERTSHIPVILLTAKNESQSRLEGLKTGADDYLTKPFSTEELLVRIINLIDQRKRLAERFRERILVAPALSQENSLDDTFLLKVKDAVETHMDDFSFSVEKLAEEINLSRTQLLRKLKALTGLSPNEFIKDMRLKKAADMIRQKADTITQIGYAVGFNDQSYFTKCFKKQFGITPSEYASQSAKG